jgi:hypothetical protein
LPDLIDQLEGLLDEYINSLPWYRRWGWKAWLWANGGLRAATRRQKIGCLLIFLLMLIGLAYVLYQFFK